MSIQALGWAFRQQIRPAAAKFTLVALANFADEHGYGNPSQETLAAMTCQTDRSVRDHLSTLESLGLISRSHHRESRGTYETDTFQLHINQRPAEDLSGGGHLRKILPTEELSGGDQRKPFPEVTSGNRFRRKDFPEVEFPSNSGESTSGKFFRRQDFPEVLNTEKNTEKNTSFSVFSGEEKNDEMDLVDESGSMRTTPSEDQGGRHSPNLSSSPEGKNPSVGSPHAMETIHPALMEWFYLYPARRRCSVAEMARLFEPVLRPLPNSPTPPSRRSLIEALKANVASDNWRKEDGKWVPSMKRYISERRWELPAETNSNPWERDGYIYPIFVLGKGLTWPPGYRVPPGAVNMSRVLDVNGEWIANPTLY